MPSDDELKTVYQAYATFGKKDGLENFASKDFVKFVKDAGFYTDKGNKFNIKPPNRVDFVFTYAATNGPNGKRGNKTLTFEQFLYALRGIGKELDEEEEAVRIKTSIAKPSTNAATRTVSTRFHDDESNYTGAHADKRGVDRGDKSAIRRNRSLKALEGDEYKAAVALQERVEATFVKYDADASGFLEAAEVVDALRDLKPEATPEALVWVKDLLMATADVNGDGKLSQDEFVNAFNRLVELLQLMGDGNADIPQEKEVVRTKYRRFAEFAPGGAAADAELDSARFKLFCEQLFPATFPRTQAGATEIDLIFTEALRVRRAKAPQSKKIGFDEFFDVALVMIAKKAGKTLPNVLKVVMATDGPQASTGVTKADGVRFHDDKSSYTGAQGDKAGVDKERRVAKAEW